MGVTRRISRAVRGAIARAGGGIGGGGIWMAACGDGAGIGEAALGDADTDGPGCTDGTGETPEADGRGSGGGVLEGGGAERLARGFGSGGACAGRD